MHRPLYFIAEFFSRPPGFYILLAPALTLGTGKKIKFKGWQSAKEGSQLAKSRNVRLSTHIGAIGARVLQEAGSITNDAGAINIFWNG